jgi:hypothetical protein
VRVLEQIRGFFLDELIGVLGGHSGQSAAKTARSRTILRRLARAAALGWLHVVGKTMAF